MSVVVSARTGVRWTPVIGLEVHCQLATRTKLFCGCPNAFGAPPNTNVCPVCTGQPGALPVLNDKALALALRAALALGCDVAPWSKFDRKNYFYCDLPKGYQISQYDRPYCRGGGIVLAGGKRVRLTRIHIEEDAGKAIHDRGPNTLVDFNRAGVPLVEAVTEPDLASAEEAFEYLTALKEILQYAGASECDMEKGSLRCDVNVSVRREGEDLRTKVELKNLNSFKNVYAAIEHEVARQVEAWESDDPARHPVQETRLFDPDRGVTRTMRAKEHAHDYRYFPDPDLPPVYVDAAALAAQRALVPELPAARRARYTAELGLAEAEARVLTSDRLVADFFEETARLSGDAAEASKWIANELSSIVNERGPLARLADLGVRAASLAELMALVAQGSVSKTAARTILRAMAETGRAPGELLRELGLEQVSDGAELEAWCRAALVGREAIVADVRAGVEKALGALVGPVMKTSGGKADPKRVREILQRLIRDGTG